MSEMTPEEACKKWCPMYRSNNEINDNRSGKCLADECAEWVWIKKGQQPPTKGKCGLEND
jgi:hypothetical protein